MSIVRMTSVEMKKSVTAAMLSRAKQTAKHEPDLTDPDTPDMSGLLRAEVKRRRGRPVKEIKKGEKKSIYNPGVYRHALTI